MVYFRRQARRMTRRRRGRRTAWYNRKYSTAQIARAAWRSAKYIRGLVNSEMFHKSNQLVLGANQHNIWCINGMPQGDGEDQRTGNSILCKTFVMNGYIYINSSQTTNTRLMIALVLDKQQVADVSPAVTDIFTDQTDPSTLLNTSNFGRFQIMSRRQYTLSSNSAGDNSKQVKLHVPLNFHTRFNGSAQTDINKMGLYLVIITSESSLHPTVVLNTRLSYHDN